MRWHPPLAASLMVLGLAACERLGMGGGSEAADTAQAQLAAPDTTPPPEPVVQEPVQPAPAPVRRVVSAPMAEEPWTPTFSGTVSPGMSRDEVVAVWGPPVAERMVGARGYLYFRNGCEVSCGTFDVVFLDGGLVVDAIVRGAGHTYGGTSSSPSGRLPEASVPPGSGVSGSDG